MRLTAICGRKLKNGSRPKQHTSRKRKLEITERRVTFIREESLSNIVKINKPSAKKSVRTMSSTTTYPTRKENVLLTVAEKER